MSFVLAAFAVPAVSAQLVSATPDPLYQDSKNIVVTYRPDDANSNGALKNLPASTEVYAHIGVITTESANDGDWKHAPAWGTNNAKYKLTYVSPNVYTLNIGDLQSYFGLTSNEMVKKIAFVFRTADSSKEGKTKANKDIFLDVNGLFVETDPNVTSVFVGESVEFTLKSTLASNLTMKANGTLIASANNATQLKHTYTFDKSGDCEFEFSDGTRTFTKTIEVVGGVTVKDYPGGVPQPGALIHSNGNVTFCLPAPDKTIVRLVGSWDYSGSGKYPEDLDSQIMNCCVYNGYRYFWKTVEGLDMDTQYLYYYVVDSEGLADAKKTKVADPYGKLILDRSNDTPLKNLWKESDNYPLPTFPITAITNCPFLTVFHGKMNDYDWEPFEIPNHSNLFIYEMLFRDFTGTEGEAKGNGTVRAAIEKIPYLKNLGVNAVELMPIMEFNGNNSWGYNPNFYFSPDKAYGTIVDYKDFINECHKNGIAVILDIVFNQSDGNTPWYSMYPRTNNPFYNASAPHDYSVLNDWNQDNPIVKQMWDDCVKYWLREYNVDGFRFDLVKGLGDNGSYGSGTEAFNQSRVNNMVRIHKAMKQVKPRAIHINEFLGSASEELKYTDDYQLVWAKYSDNCYSFAKGNATQLSNLSGRGQGSVPAMLRVTYAESHDEERVAYLASTQGIGAIRTDQQARMNRLGTLAVQHILQPGPKMIWQFEELAADQSTKNGSNNDTGSKKVVWSNLENDYIKNLYDTYSAIGQLRRQNEWMFSSLDNLTYNSRYIIMRLGDKEVIAFFNPGRDGEAVKIAVTAQRMTPENSMLICAATGAVPTLSVNGSGQLETTVAPNSYVVYATKNINGVSDMTVDDFGSKFEVYGGFGEINIVGDYRNAEVFNLQGLSMGRLDNLDRGIYVVRVDGETFKVSVR